ncbi:MAG: penicillin-binding protein 2 [Oceanococcus sp.]|nr:MAG: penicillin-binding protein 2 [Oceanococcus sp.]
MSLSKSQARNKPAEVPAGPAPAWRQHVLVGLLVLGFVALGLRAFELQVRDRDFLLAEGERRHVRTLLEPGGRGAVRDRHGAPLALSAPVESIWVVPSALLAEPAYIAPLANLLAMQRGELQAELEKRRGRQFYYLKRQLPPSEARRILDLDAPGVFSQREYRRYYPAGEVTAQLVGLCNIDGVGQEGLERGFDSLLAGSPGQRLVIQDRLGRVVDDLDEFRASRPGQDVDLSIDLRLQHYAYGELKAAVSAHNAKGGVILVADVQTGEILALATQPGFNPNNRNSLGENRAAWRNRAALDQFEPGSTVKPLMLAAALQNNIIDASEQVDTGNGWIKIGRLQVRDYRGYGQIGLTELLAKSSNVGAVKVGMLMGADRLFDAYRAFGFGYSTASGFPGEVAGQLTSPYEWGDVGTATASYGYGMSVTALQLAQAYMVLAADGVRRTLSLVKGGSQFEDERIISAEVAAQVREMLTAVVQPGGTGTRAAVPGYRVAGKTGTVRKAEGGGYAEDRHQSLFVGMLPADQPRLLSLVVIDEPRSGVYYGGLVAAPVFSRVASSAARLLQIAPAEGDHSIARVAVGDSHS